MPILGTILQAHQEGLLFVLLPFHFPHLFVNWFWWTGIHTSHSLIMSVTGKITILFTLSTHWLWGEQDATFLVESRQLWVCWSHWKLTLKANKQIREILLAPGTFYVISLHVEPIHTKINFFANSLCWPQYHNWFSSTQKSCVQNNEEIEGWTNTTMKYF